MKIEKINENKLKIVLSKQDLIEKNINMLEFNKNSIESQDLFFDILQEVEDSYNFDLSESQILIEGFSSSNGGLILTITKTMSGIELTKKENIIVKRKIPQDSWSFIVYQFDDFENLIDFSLLFNKVPLKFANSLYVLNDKYYLLFKTNMQSLKTYKKMTVKISDYANFIPIDNFKNQLDEFGKEIIKDNAIQVFNKQFKK